MKRNKSGRDLPKEREGKRLRKLEKKATAEFLRFNENLRGRLLTAIEQATHPNDAARLAEVLWWAGMAANARQRAGDLSAAWLRLHGIGK